MSPRPWRTAPHGPRSPRRETTAGAPARQQQLTGAGLRGQGGEEGAEGGDADRGSQHDRDHRDRQRRPRKTAMPASRRTSQTSSTRPAATALPVKIAAGLADVSSIASSEPCSFSPAKVRPKTTRPAKTSTSQRIPGLIRGPLVRSRSKAKLAITSASATNCASAGSSSRPATRCAGLARHRDGHAHSVRKQRTVGGAGGVGPHVELSSRCSFQGLRLASGGQQHAAAAELAGRGTVVGRHDDGSLSMRLASSPRPAASRPASARRGSGGPGDAAPSEPAPGAAAVRATASPPCGRHRLQPVSASASATRRRSTSCSVAKNSRFSRAVRAA